MATNETAQYELEKAFRADSEKLFQFIRRRIRTDEDAEDILQEVFSQLVATYSVTEPIEKITSWLFAVAKNKVIDWYRKRKTTTLTAKEDDEGETRGLEDVLFNPFDTPDEVYGRSIVWAALADALEELPEEQRSVFVMHEMDGMSFKEIAGITGTPVNTLLSRKRYAVLHLRDRLQEIYDEFQNS